MEYIKPDANDINFVLYSGYSSPSINNIHFKLGTTTTGTTPSGIDYVEGSVLEVSTALPGTVLHLYKRSTGELISSTVTTVSGTFGLPYVDSEEYYFVVALYPTNKYNALVYDYVYPTTSGGPA